MSKKILVISGSPQKHGNTEALIDKFSEGARSMGATVELVRAAELRLKFPGCTSCRACQKAENYGCVIEDDAREVLAEMTRADVIVMATPLYFFAASAQLKVLIDRMFSLYKWDNTAGTFTSPLKGKVLLLIGSAYEDVGLDVLEKPFALTATYTGMGFRSLLVPNAGVSGDLAGQKDILRRAFTFGEKAACDISQGEKNGPT
ncbi:MAG: flavodoxin family protein [Candidatus Omnitrophica bacterium]|nr:flavodoxin family protein [Candidatus Omnitrophota bacterium]